MAYSVTEDFRTVVYSGDANYDCKLYINDTRVPVEQISSIKISSPIIDTSDDTGSTYHIGTFISQQIEVKFRNLDGLELTNNPEIYLEIGVLVNDAYEYVPIGHYLIDDLGEDYQSTCTITCLDYAVKFKPQLDISQFFGESNTIYADELFKAICGYYGVAAGEYPIINNNKIISQYDSDLSGKEYIGYLAELFGGNAKIDRNGRCCIFALNGATNEEVSGTDISISNAYQSSSPFTIIGKCEQDGTPTPDEPIDIETIKDNILISTSDGTTSITYTLPLQQEFCAIGDYKDTFVKQGGKWYEKHYIGKIESYNGETIETSYISTTGELTTGAIIYYILATPTLIECTEEQQTILNNGIVINKGATYITSDAELTTNYMKEKTDTIEINALESSSFTLGDSYKISRVCYDNGTVKYQGGVNIISVDTLPTTDIDTNSTYYLTNEMKYYNYVNEEWTENTYIKNTLYIRIDNLFITDQSYVTNIYNLLKDFEVYNLKCKNRLDISLDCWDIVKYTTDEGSYETFYDNSFTFNGVAVGDVAVELPLSTKEETTNILQESTESKIKRIRTIINEEANSISTLVEKTTTIEGGLNEANTNINNNYQDIINKLDGYATAEDVVTVKNSVETIQTDTQRVVEVVEDIQVNGVDKVTTKTGFTFDDEGLTIEKTGAKTKSILDETGLDIKDATGSSDADLLFAGYDETTGETIVKSKNMTVEKYLVVGTYTRFEDYKDANNVQWTGAFWLG